jgi:hypothetical protein
MPVAILYRKAGLILIDRFLLPLSSVDISFFFKALGISQSDCISFVSPDDDNVKYIFFKPQHVVLSAFFMQSECTDFCCAKYLVDYYLMLSSVKEPCLLQEFSNFDPSINSKLDQIINQCLAKKYSFDYSSIDSELVGLLISFSSVLSSFIPFVDSLYSDVLIASNNIVSAQDIDSKLTDVSFSRSEAKNFNFIPIVRQLLKAKSRVVELECLCDTLQVSNEELLLQFDENERKSSELELVNSKLSLATSKIEKLELTLDQLESQSLDYQLDIHSLEDVRRVLEHKNAILVKELAESRSFSQDFFYHSNEQFMKLFKMLLDANC